MSLDVKQQSVLDHCKNKENVFVTGPGGTGKSFLIKTLLNYFINIGKKIAVCALTGVSAELLECNAKTITKAGIHAEVVEDDGSVPVTVFIARDHHYTDSRFAKVVENDKLLANVIGVRFELNDPYICVIAKLVEPKSSKIGNDREKTTKKPALNILED